MPPWWRRRSKSSASSHSKEADAAIVKAKSFDAVSFFDLPEPERKTTGHPLPLPEGSCWATYASSPSSAEESPERGNLRSPGAEIPWRGKMVVLDSQRQLPVATEERYHSFGCTVPDHERMPTGNVSPRRNHGSVLKIITNGMARMHQRVHTDSIISPESRSPAPRGCNVSPVSPKVFDAPDTAVWKLDDLRSPLHPLPRPPVSPPSTSSPSVESQWKKGKLLGRGTFGCVFVGFNSESGQMCAIKEVEAIPDDSNSKECLKQLNQEINLLSQLSHPNIVQYFGSELNDDTLAVYLEYMSGGSLHKLVQDYGPLKESVIRNFVRQILSGLAYLHGKNCVHRDIKGANILVGPNGDIKLADFGMAKHISSCASLRSFRGSPFWMAPEVVRHSNGYSLPVDIWSLGCTIIEMANSKPPWNKYTEVQAIFKIGNSNEIPEIPNHLSSDAQDFVKLCLQRDPTVRPTAAQLMEHPFVRKLGKIRTPRPNTMRDAQPFPDGIQSPTTPDFVYSRSISPFHDRDYTTRPTAGNSPLQINPRRTNISVPVSPCSSPLRQAMFSNRSCYLSPPRQSYPTELVNTAQCKYPLYPLSPNRNRYTDNWPEIPQNVRGLYASPWRSQLLPLPPMAKSRV